MAKEFEPNQFKLESIIAGKLYFSMPRAKKLLRQAVKNNGIIDKLSNLGQMSVDEVCYRDNKGNEETRTFKQYLKLGCPEVIAVRKEYIKIR